MLIKGYVMVYFFTESGTGLQGFEDKEKSEQQHHHDDKQWVLF